MEKPSRALLVAIALVVMIAVSLHLTLWLDETCNVAGRRAVMKASGGIGCFEFWLNRYQGLLGNVLTAGVAALTLLWINRQFKAAKQQSAATSADSIRKIKDDLIEERNLIIEIIENSALIRNKYWLVDDVVVRQAAKKEAEEIIHNAEIELSEKLKGLLELGFDATSPLFAARQAAYETMKKFQIEAHGNVPFSTPPEVQTRVDLGLYGYDFEFDYRRRYRTLVDLGGEAHAVSEVYLRELEAQIATAWKRLREFETAAIAPG